MKWREDIVASAIARQVFQHKHLVMVPNCNWTGCECDLLVVTRDLRIIDVEVKISRADLKADAKKDKWWSHAPSTWQNGRYVDRPATARAWPPKVWKHYYAMPIEVWREGIMEGLPANSGVLTLRERKTAGFEVSVQRQAKPDRDAKKIEPADVLNIARLASLRLWDAYARLEVEKAEVDGWRTMALTGQ